MGISLNAENCFSFNMENLQLFSVLFLVLAALYQGSLTTRASQEEEILQTVSKTMEEMEQKMHKLIIKVNMIDDMRQEIEMLNIEAKKRDEENMRMTMKIHNIEKESRKIKMELQDLKMEMLKGEDQRQGILSSKVNTNDTQEKGTIGEFSYIELGEETRALSEEVTMLKSIAKGQEQQIRKLRDPPIVYYCGYTQTYSGNSSIVLYSSLFYSFNNQGTGGLDISTGTFAAPYPGTYRVTYSLYADNDIHENNVVMHIQKNGDSIPESKHFSSYSGDAGSVNDQGGVGILLHLDMGATVSLYCDDCSAKVHDILFSVNLEQF